MASERKANIEIFSIKEESYNFQNLKKDDIDNFDSSKLSVGLKIDFSTNPDSDILFIFPSVIYSYDLNGKEIELINIRCKFEYEIILDGDRFRKSDKVHLPSEVMEYLVPVTFHTLRGMIAVKTAGNFLTNYPLPLFQEELMIDALNKSAKKLPTTKKSVKQKRK